MALTSLQFDWLDDIKEEETSYLEKDFFGSTRGFLTHRSGFFWPIRPFFFVSLHFGKKAHNKRDERKRERRVLPLDGGGRRRQMAKNGKGGWATRTLQMTADLGRDKGLIANRLLPILFSF